MRKFAPRTRFPACAVDLVGPHGLCAAMRLNFVQPPFADKALRQALLPASDQADFMSAILGDDPRDWRPMAGVFTLGTGMETDVDKSKLIARIPALEELRASWFDATSDAARKQICVDIQRVALDEVAFIPLGNYNTFTALRSDLTDRVSGFALFWNLRRA